MEEIAILDWPKCNTDATSLVLFYSFLKIAKTWHFDFGALAVRVTVVLFIHHTEIWLWYVQNWLG